ncbi:zinc finger protein [Cinnamomum micranthum f. kanehirae]|uniref:Zinc finger protein n=1 Tax=Cinnamomum micranthum f. kanehirae TaxID=337451 RepID=A0A443P8T8_9MAGN|nr:zinc finger protein [Cinnamomum micranthum f. kanehirae]
MESEDKQRIHHPPGHDNHGVHVCHKCGWAFPNPHPSAKHRRAHKKVCGKLTGSKIPGSEEKFNHSDSDSDEAHKHSTTGQGLGDKVSGTVALRPSRSEEELFTDAVAEFADAESHHTEEGVVISDKMPQPNDSTQGDQIKEVHAIESEPEQLGSGVHLEGHALHSIPDATGASTSDKKTNAAVEQTQLSSSDVFLLSSSSPLEPTVPTSDSKEDSSFSFGEDVNPPVSVVGTDADAGVNGAITEDKILSATAILPATEVEFSETNSSTLTTRVDSFKDAVMDFKDPDSTISLPHEEQCDVSAQQKDPSEKLSELELGPVEVEAGEQLGASIDTHQVPQASLHNDSRTEVYETMAENASAVSSLEAVPAGDNTDMKSDACKDHMPLKPEVTQTLASVEEMESNSHCSHPVLEQSHSGSMSIKSDEDVFPTTVQMQEVNLQADGSKELIVDQSGVGEDPNREASQYLGISSSECATKEIHSNGLGTPSDSTKEFTPDDPVMGSSEADAAQSRSEDSKEGSLGEGKPHQIFSHEVLPEVPVVPVDGGSSAVSSVATEVHQEIAKGSEGFVVHKESVTVHADAVLGYGEALTEDENSLCSTLVTNESAINATEMKSQMHDNAGGNEVDGNLQLTEATDVFVVLESKGIDVGSCSLESVSDNSRQSCHNEVDQESSKEHAPEEPVKLPDDPESFVRSPFTPAKIDTNYSLDGDDVYEGGDNILKQDASTSVLVADPSVDSVAEESNKSQEEVFSDAVVEFSGSELRHAEKGVVVSDTIPHPNDSVYDDQVQNLHDLERKTDLLDGGIPLQDHALHSTPDGSGASTSDTKTNMVAEQTASLLDPAAPTNDSTENPNSSCGADVNSSVAVVGLDIYAEGTGESTEDKILPATAIFPANEVEFLSDTTNINTIIARDGPSEDTVNDLKVLDSTISHTHEEQSNASGQQEDQSEMSPRMQAGLVEVEAGRDLVVSADTDQVPQAEACLHSDRGADVYETKVENLPAFSTPEIVPAMNTAEMKSDTCKDHMALKPEVTQTLTTVEVMESHSHCSGLVESQSRSMPIESAESTDVFSAAMQNQEVNLQVDEPAIRSMSKELIVDQSGVGEDLTEETSQFIGFSSHESVAKEVHFNGMGTLSDSIGAFTPDDAVMRSSEVVPTQSQSNDNKLGSLGEEEPHRVLSHELLPEDPTVPVTGGGITVPSAATEFHEEITKENGGYGIHEDTKTVHTNGVRDYGETGTKDGNSLSGTQVPHESATNVMEMNPQMLENAGVNEELLPVEEEPSDQSSFNPSHNGNEYLTKGVASEGGNTILKNDSSVPVLIVDASVDSLSQTDSVEGTWGSVSQSQSNDNKLGSSNDNKLGSLGEEEPHCVLSHELLPEDPTVPVTGGGITGSSAATEFHEEIAKEICGYGIHEDTKSFHTNGVGGYGETGTKDGNSLSGTQVPHESATNVMEMNPQMLENAGVNEELLPVEEESSDQSSFSPSHNGNEYLTKGIASEGGNTILKKDASASVLIVDASVDSLSQTDGVEGTWGSVSQSQSNDNKLGSLGEEEPHRVLSHELLPEDPTVPVTAGGITGSSAATEFHEEIAKEIGGYGIHEDTRSVHTNGVRGYGETGTKDGNSLSGTQVPHESATNVMEMNPQMLENAGVNEELLPVEEEPSDQSSFNPSHNGNEYLTKGVASEGGNTILKNDSSVPVLIVDASVDSLSQTDSVEGTWGSVSQSQSNDNKLGSLGEEEPHRVLSHELLPEDPTVPVTGGGITGSSAATEFHEEIAKEICGYGIHEDTKSFHTNGVGGYGETGTKDGNSLSGTKVPHESATNVMEMNPQMLENAGVNEELLPVEEESSVQSSFSPSHNGNEYLTKGDASEGGNTILKKDASASVLIVDASVDSLSQTDSVEGTWGSVSDGMVPSIRDASDAMPILQTETLSDINIQAPKEVSVTNSMKQNPADNTDVFEPPSFMTLVEPTRGDNICQSSAEIQSGHNLQPSSTSQIGWFPSLTNVVNESQGRKKNEEIIAKVVNWSPGKPHTPLRNLLVDANHEGKHMASTPAQDHRTLKSHEGPVPEVDGVPAKTALEVSTVPTAKETTNTEWNSPARLPVIKREKRKVRGYLAPFVCCLSHN